MSKDEKFHKTNKLIEKEWTGTPIEGTTGICDDAPDAPGCDCN